MANQQVYSVSTLGGNTTNPYLTDKLRAAAQPLFRFRQFLDAKEAIGKGRGDTWLFDKRTNVGVQGGTLSETNTIPETNFNTNQGTGVITEYGNAVPYTAKLDALGKFDIGAITEAALRDDQVKVLESAAGAQFVLTDFARVEKLRAPILLSTPRFASGRSRQPPIEPPWSSGGLGGKTPISAS